MDEPTDIRTIDTREVVRDLINWMDGTDAGWRYLEPTARRDLLVRARRYFEGVSRRYGIPESEFGTPLRDAVESVVRDHMP